MARTNLADMRYLVRDRVPFQGNSVHAENRGELYVVFSYGEHFPMYVHDRWGGWFKNTGRYSRTTSRHQSACNPGVFDMAGMETDELRELVRCGSWLEYMARRLGAEHG